ncbi:universal stress protein [Candidatus Obscuribacterales bacterium]|nr:universal stress protein [Candidatus Obscuribacterales bacterium]MBX3136213.1 universal stress protein [Candidatus Obscuribacterales bacterium]
MNILLAIDGSTFSHAAVDEVLNRPWPSDTRFKVLTVVEPFHPEYAGWHGNYVPVAMEAQKELIDSSQSLVNQTAAQLGARFAPEQIESEVKEGYIKDVIIEVAKDWHADLIIMGSHGRKGITKFLLGSVSEGVLSEAPCSVEIVKIKSEQEKLAVGNA